MYTPISLFQSVKTDKNINILRFPKIVLSNNAKKDYLKQNSMTNPTDISERNFNGINYICLIKNLKMGFYFLS